MKIAELFFIRFLSFTDSVNISNLRFTHIILVNLKAYIKFLKHRISGI